MNYLNQYGESLKYIQNNTYIVHTVLLSTLGCGIPGGSYLYGKGGGSSKQDGKNMHKPTPTGAKPHYLRRLKDIAERLPTGTVIRYAAMAEKRRKG